MSYADFFILLSAYIGVFVILGLFSCAVARLLKRSDFSNVTNAPISSNKILLTLSVSCSLLLIIPLIVICVVDHQHFMLQQKYCVYTTVDTVTFFQVLHYPSHHVFLTITGVLFTVLGYCLGIISYNIGYKRQVAMFSIIIVNIISFAIFLVVMHDIALLTEHLISFCQALSVKP